MGGVLRDERFPIFLFSGGGNDIEKMSVGGFSRDGRFPPFFRFSEALSQFFPERTMFGGFELLLKNAYA